MSSLRVVIEGQNSDHDFLFPCKINLDVSKQHAAVERSPPAILRDKTMADKFPLILLKITPSIDYN